MSKPKPENAVLRVHPFPTLLAQTFQLVELAQGADSGTHQVLAKSAVVFAAMTLECAATSCLELTGVPNKPAQKMERTLGMLDKFDLLHWMAVRKPLDRGLHVVQKIDELVTARNEQVHSRVRRHPFGSPRTIKAGDEVDAPYDKRNWDALGIPRDERSWQGTHARAVFTAAVDFLNYFFLAGCQMSPDSVRRILRTSSGTVEMLTPWETSVLAAAEQRTGLKFAFWGSQ